MRIEDLDQVALLIRERCAPYEDTAMNDKFEYEVYRALYELIPEYEKVKMEGRF